MPRAPRRRSNAGSRSLCPGCEPTIELSLIAVEELGQLAGWLDQLGTNGVGVSVEHAGEIGGDGPDLGGNEDDRAVGKVMGQVAAVLLVAESSEDGAALAVHFDKTFHVHSIIHFPPKAKVLKTT